MIFDFILWLIFGPAPREVADSNCYLCRGRGSYGGLRGYPGAPGLSAITCSCVTRVAVPENRPWVKKRQRRRQQEAERRAQQEAEREAYLASIPQVMNAEPQPAYDPYADERIRRWQWTGEATLCCRRLE